MTSPDCCSPASHPRAHPTSPSVDVAQYSSERGGRGWGCSSQQSSACCARHRRRATPSRRMRAGTPVSCCQMPPTYADVPSSAVTTTPIGSSSADAVAVATTSPKSSTFALSAVTWPRAGNLGQKPRAPGPRYGHAAGGCGACGEVRWLSLSTCSRTPIPRRSIGSAASSARSTTCRSHISHAQVSARVAVASRSVRVEARSRGGWPGRSERRVVCSHSTSTAVVPARRQPPARGEGRGRRHRPDSRGAVGPHPRATRPRAHTGQARRARQARRLTAPSAAGSSSRTTTRPRSARRIATDPIMSSSTTWCERSTGCRGSRRSEQLRSERARHSSRPRPRRHRCERTRRHRDRRRRLHAGSRRQHVPGVGWLRRAGRSRVRPRALPPAPGRPRHDLGKPCAHDRVGPQATYILKSSAG